MSWPSKDPEDYRGPTPLLIRGSRARRAAIFLSLGMLMGAAGNLVNPYGLRVALAIAGSSSLVAGTILLWDRRRAQRRPQWIRRG